MVTDREHGCQPVEWLSFDRLDRSGFDYFGLRPKRLGTPFSNGSPQHFGRMNAPGSEPEDWLRHRVPNTRQTSTETPAAPRSRICRTKFRAQCVEVMQCISPPVKHQNSWAFTFVHVLNCKTLNN